VGGGVELDDVPTRNDRSKGSSVSIAQLGSDQVHRQGLLALALIDREGPEESNADSRRTSCDPADAGESEIGRVYEVSERKSREGQVDVCVEHHCEKEIRDLAE